MPDASTAGAARDRIVEEHRHLRILLDRVGEIDGPARLAAELGELQTLLIDHFEGEEADDGLHEAVGRSTPHLLPAVQHLFDEHRQFLTDLEALIGRARQLAAGPMAELHGGVAHLAERLRAHEARENDLFGESVYADVGSQD
jgi:hypothetical protein